MKCPGLCFWFSPCKLLLAPAVPCRAFWRCSLQLAAPVYPVGVQGPVTKTLCQGTNGHTDHSHWHERPEQGRAISIRKDDIPVSFPLPYCTIYINTVPRTVVGSPHFVSHVSTVTEQKWALCSTWEVPRLCESAFCLYFISLFFIWRGEKKKEK